RAGLYRDFALSPRWTLTGHFSVGAAARRQGTDLGNTIEFMTGLDLFYHLQNGWRLGPTLSHVSNGGLADNNPGVENLGMLVALPLH
ncbi:MAG TPA: acyloxyacyl hydrolase, partial [Burkholderiales bacterium]